MGRSAPSELIRLAIKANRTNCRTYEEFEIIFQGRANATLDYIRRVLAGTRPISDQHVAITTDILKLEIDFSMSERELASALGLSRREAATTIGNFSGGLDLTARTADRSQIRRLHALIAGYWESIYWSVSNTKEQAISRDLCIIGDIDEENYIQCRVLDGHFEYSGVVFPVVQHLYFILEKDRIFNEVIFYITNLPDRTPPLLRGIIGCLSGGVNDSRSYPSASKVAFRFLGRRPAEIRQIYPRAPDNDEDLLEFLKASVPRYINGAEIAGGELTAAARLEIEAIDNTIPSTAVPFALRSSD